MRPLSLAAGVLPEFTPLEVIRAAALAGYEQVGLTIDPRTCDDAMVARMQAELDAQAGALNVLDVEVVWIDPGGLVTDAHRRIIEVGGALGARNVLVVSSEPHTARTTEAFARLCELAGAQGMRAALEFLMITEVRRLADALAIVRGAQHPSAAVLVDTLHLARSGEPVRMLADVEPHLMPYVQLCDGRRACASDHASLLEDAIDGRTAPGEGELPLREVLGYLDPHLPASLEVRSRAYRQRFPGAVDRAVAVLEQTRRFLGPDAAPGPEA